MVPSSQNNLAVPLRQKEKLSDFCDYRHLLKDLQFGK
jgi:hypothetical protein